MTTSEQTYPDLLVPPFWGLTERLPINAKRVTDDDELAFTLDAAILYCYFPVITENNQLIFLNPYDETQELFTLTIDKDEVVKRFRPEGDVAVISAVTLGFPSSQLPQKIIKKALTQLVTLATSEIRKGLSLPLKRGELLSLDLLKVANIQTQEIVDFMGIGDRLDPQFEDKPCSLTTEIGLFVHNSMME